MELPVMHQGEQIGSCKAERMGLYWNLDCSCRSISDRVERLYWRTTRLGILERKGNTLHLNRRLSQNSLMGFAEKAEALYLQPMYQILDQYLPPTDETDGKLWYPFGYTKVFPCMPLVCFFSLEQKQGKLYWTIPLNLSYSAE